MSANLAEKRYSISPQEAAQELLRRQDATQNLLSFTEYTTLNWSAGKIHKEVCKQLDRIVSGEIDRLMLLCPPQHGKSSIASRRFPAYMLGKMPRMDVISASATASLAEEFGRDVRNCIASQEYRNLFDTTLAEDSQAKGRWNTSNGGGYYAVGVGTALMGRGGELAIIDDPFATWEDSQSELERERVWQWYTGTLYNRVRPGGAIILIQHRMHEDDLAGRLIAEQEKGGDKWEIVKFPALFDDPPWPERYDRPALERIKANVRDLRKWSALYLQEPTPEEGTFFQRDWFKFYDPKKLPACHKYTSGDFAVTDGDGDYTEIATHGYTGELLYAACDSYYGQTTADKWIESAIDQFGRHKPFCFFGESGPIRRAIEPFLTRRMSERKTYVRLEWLPRSADKPTMARPLQAMAAQGKVLLPDNDYGHRLLSQLLGFPGGKYDDAVDMLVMMAMAIDQAHPALIREKPKPQVVDRWDRAFKDKSPGNEWKTV